MGKKNRFHACATCINFSVEKNEAGMNYNCIRLGYETRPDYVFNCWEPKAHIVELITKDQLKSEG